MKGRLGWGWTALVGLALACAATVPDASVPVAASASANANATPPGARGEPLPSPEAPAAGPPPGAHCQPALNPAADTWQSLEGCNVTFKPARVIAERECTMAMCGDQACCNRCSAGGLALLSGNHPLLLSSSRAPLMCRQGRDCDAYRDCDVPPGDAEVSGVLWRREDRWYLDTQRFVRRIGSCELKTAELTASKLSPTDGCRTTFACDDGRQVAVSCDGENDGTNTSLCECQLGDRTVSLPAAISGEAPLSCERAIEPCLSRGGKKRK